MKNPNNAQSLQKPFNIQTGFIWLVYVFILIQWLITGIDTSGDATTYIHMDPLRTPGYPIFVKITTLFGLIHGFRSTSFVALILGLYIIHRFCNFLKKEFNLSSFWIIMSSLVLLYPYLFLDLKNCILTETLAYPLFILTVQLLLKSLFDKRSKTAILYFVATALLLFVRPQFVYFYGISILLIIYLAWYSKNKAKSSFLLIGVFVLCAAGENLLEKTYHLVLHKHFEVPSFFGIQFEVLPLYNLHDKDVDLFSNPLERGMVDTVLSYEKKNVLYNFRSQKHHASEWETFIYEHIYNDLTWRTSEKYFLNVVGKQGLKNDNLAFWDYLNSVTTHIGIVLIKAHPKEYALIYLMLLNSSFGFSAGFFPFLLLFFFSVWLFFKTGNKSSLLILAGCIILALNNILICFFEPLVGRYTMYCYYLFPVIIFIPLMKFMEGTILSRSDVPQIDEH